MPLVIYEAQVMFKFDFLKIISYIHNINIIFNIMILFVQIYFFLLQKMCLYLNLNSDCFILCDQLIYY